MIRGGLAVCLSGLVSTILTGSLYAQGATPSLLGPSSPSSSTVPDAPCATYLPGC
jgi:hypothetical protein